MQPEPIVDRRCVTGECPLWHPDERLLYWVDIPSSKLFRCDPAARTCEAFETGEPVGGFTIQEDGRLLLFMARGAVRLWQNGFAGTVIDGIPEERDNRFNDVIADPEGRVYCGVMSTPSRPGRLYRLDTDGTITPLLEGIGTSNGMGFTPDLKRMYYTDTRRREIYLFDYDRETGAIANRRVFARADSDGRPDGMTVDSEGAVWSARWDGYCLVRYDAGGRLVARIKFPVKKVSCVTFGGPEYTDMFVTTAGGNDTAENGEHAGALFHLDAGVRGVPEFRSRIGV
jgi:D-xylonolactonase